MNTEWIVAISPLVASLVFVFCFLRWIRRKIKEENESRRRVSILDVERIQSDFRAIADEVKAEILEEVAKKITEAAEEAAAKTADLVATKAAEEVLRRYTSRNDSSK